MASRRGKSWEAIAHELGQRLRHYAFVCPDHPDAPDPTGCPFCRDTVAYVAYRAKCDSLGVAGWRAYEPDPDGVSVPIGEVPVTGS